MYNDVEGKILRKKDANTKKFFGHSISERWNNDNSFGTKGIGQKRKQGNEGARGRGNEGTSERVNEERGKKEGNEEPIKNNQ